MSGAKRAPSSSVKNATASGRRVTPPRSSVSIDLEPGEHPVVAVVSAAGADGVDVRAGHDGGALARVPRSDHVADGVDGDGEVQVLHPGDDQVAAPPVLVGEGQPAAPAVARVADRGQLLQPADQAGVIGSEAGMEAGAGHAAGTAIAASVARPVRFVKETGMAT